jgi:methylthioribose-1-phosphate isomerase
VPVKTIEWKQDHIRIIDQTLLPEELVYLDIFKIPVLGEAIQKLRIRGAPAIGVAGAMGVALSAFQNYQTDSNTMVAGIRKDIQYLRSTRPTGVNLFWALDSMEKILNAVQNETPDTIRKHLIEEAVKIWEGDRQICRQLGKNGTVLLKEKTTVLTHCNAGGLATADFGTALGVIYAAAEMGKNIKVYTDETRPLLQGSRLTAWELKESGIDVTVLCDSAAGTLLKDGYIDCVIVGADRIAENGDTANKIGTYSLAVLANAHQIPFYVAAPVSTFDLTLSTGKDIPIENRPAEEVVFSFDKKTAPKNVAVFNPAFDVTPYQLVTAFITERGVHYPPYEDFEKEFK